MPSRNIIKTDVDETFYHIYSRGLNKQAIYLDESDYAFFISLFKRYLNPGVFFNNKRAMYPNYSNDIELLAFCLMPNHCHMLIYQHHKNSMQALMRAIMTSYSRYFNQKYKRRGPLFESRYKASNIDKGEYLEHISRYIHLNPKEWVDYPYSSIRYYEGQANAKWLQPQRILDIFNSKEEYMQFLKEYSSRKQELEDIKWQLADK